MNLLVRIAKYLANPKSSWIAVILVATLITFAFYGSIILQPNSTMMTGDGDGLKNYYTYFYHIQHDDSFSEFEGMNYPYGENFLYTDCHPLLSVLLQKLNSWFDWPSTYAIGILNFILIFSIWLTFLILYQLLRELTLRPWFAAVFAIGIGLLCPQLFRLGGHYALSYSLAIPLCWLLLVRYENYRRTRSLVFLFFTLMVLFFTHAYLGMICSFFLGMYGLVKMAGSRLHFKSALMILMVAAIPVISFYAISKAIDIHPDRTENPSGFFSYEAEREDIFLPHHKPLFPVLNQLSNGGVKFEWEALSYVGLTTTLSILTIFFLFVIQLVRRRKSATLSVVFAHRKMNQALIASLFALLFSMAIPFKQFPQLVEVLPVIKQFRGVGRFAWIFFFVGTAFTAFFIQIVFESWVKRGKAIWALALLMVSASLFIAEGLPFHKDVSGKIGKTKNTFDPSHSPYNNLLSHIDTSQFQAILPLPFYFIGSESFARPVDPESVSLSMHLSAYTGLPLFASYLTRTSISESKKIMELMGPSFYPKNVASDLDTTKAILVCVAHTGLTDAENRIIRRSALIHPEGNWSLFKLEVRHLLATDAEKEFNKFEKLLPDLIGSEGRFLSDSTALIYYNGFEDRDQDISFEGTGAWCEIKSGTHQMATISGKSFSEATQYMLRVWMYNGTRDALNLYYRLGVKMIGLDGQETAVFTLPEHSENIFGNWSLVEMEFEPPHPLSELQVITIGKKELDIPVIADELMIYKKGSLVFKSDTTDQTIILQKNNHRISQLND